MTSSSDFVGTEIGRYRIVSFLGRGGMGEVYEAIDSSLGRHVALKILSADAVADSRRVARFIQEARSASALNHPHVVSIHEIGEDGGVHFIAMERVDGSTLGRFFETGRLPVNRSLEILAQVADAVAAAHAAGIVHRDLKPENVMVSRDGYAKVLDFGLAKLQPETILEGGSSASTIPRMTEPGTVLGTVGYMSPEQVQGKPADARSDIFSLGCILYEAIAGRRAFQGATSIDTLHKIVHEEPQPLREIAPEVSAELLRIVRKTMAKDPDERYHSAKDLALDLRMLVREGSAVGAVRTVDRPRRAMLTLAGVAIALILLALAAAGLFFWRRSPSAPPPAATAFQRITAKGNLITTRVSPDGRFLAYAQFDDATSLWIRQLATGEDLQIVPRITGTALMGCTFTPDSNAIVYALRSADEPGGAFYRVATIGGEPQRVGTGTASAPAFSPDGKRMAWVREAYPSPDQSALMVGNSDGSAVRVLAVRRFPELFAPISFARPAWSPDGRIIAAPVKRLVSPVSATVVGFDPENGRARSLSDAHWVSLSALEWLPDQSGIVAIAAADAASVHATTKTGSQIWLIPHPSGTPRRITNDTLYYREVSVTSDGTKLVADLADATVHVWRKTRGTEEPASRISTGHFDGVAGVSVLPDGRVVFTSTERGTTTLWLMNPDGSGRKQLLRNPYREEYPIAFAGGIAYVATTPAATELCVTNDDGEGRRVVASPIDDSPVAVSPDGRSFAYTVHDRLWQVTADGKKRVELTRSPAWSPVYSPTGDRLAFIATEPDGAYLVVLDARTSAVTWRSSPLSSSPHWLRWADDGNGLLLSSWGPVWLFPFGGEPTKIADFGDLTWAFDVSPDHGLFVSRGTVTRDAVLITNFR